MRRRLSGPSAPLFVPLNLAALLIAASILASCAGKALGGNQGGSGNGGSAASPVTPTISWPTPSPIANTTPLSSTQLDATASVPGRFVYTPAAGTVLTAGTHALSVAFTPANPAGYNDASASVTITNQSGAHLALRYSDEQQPSPRITVHNNEPGNPGGSVPVGDAASDPFSPPAPSPSSCFPRGCAQILNFPARSRPAG
jgi:hypothetical protein